MTNTFLPKQISSKQIIAATSAFIIMFGVALRFMHLDSKLFWHDETISMFRIVGHLDSDVSEKFNLGNTISTFGEKATLLKVNNEKTVLDTLKSGSSDSHVAPLYYIFGHFWVKIFGDSVTQVRALSSVFGVGSIFAMMWCVSRLFTSSNVVWMSGALIASSPFMVLYSQEARMYSLWSLSLLICHGCFVQALRSMTNRSWIIYSTSLVFSFYSHILTLLIAASHITYVWLSLFLLYPQEAHTKTLARKFTKANLIALIFSLPWLAVILFNLSSVAQQAGWLNVNKGTLKILNTFGSSVANLFMNVPSYYLPFWQTPGITYLEKLFIFVTFILLGIVTVSFCVTSWNIWKHGKISNSIETQSIIFIACLIVVPLLIFVLPAAALDKTIGSVMRYYTPILLALEIALAVCLAILWRALSFPACICTWMVICVLSLASSHSLVQDKFAWSKGYDVGVWDVINEIQQVDQPLVVSSEEYGVSNINLLTMSYYLDPKTELVTSQSLDDMDMSIVSERLNSGQTVLAFLNAPEKLAGFSKILGQEAEVLQEKGGLNLYRFVVE